MLVLSRKRKESIQIGKNVQVVILGVNGSRVTLGITAPKEVHIVRTEIGERFEIENDAKTA